MPSERDYLSVRFDKPVRRALISAMRSRPRQVIRFVPSPPREFRDLDPRGRTRHERAFMRSAYYHVFAEPRKAGRMPSWSLKVTWGKIEKRGSRWGRPVRLRLYKYGSGYRKVVRNEATSYVEHDRLKSWAVMGER